jgi:hypothetical protein
MMGFPWGTRGLSVPFVGMCADRIGIERTLMMMSSWALVTAAPPLPVAQERHSVGTHAAADTPSDSRDGNVDE